MASTKPSINLERYFARTGHDGPMSADEDTLRALLAAHMRTIPFENLDVLLARPIGLDLESLEDKLVARRRGGYCFEHGLLFAAVLEQLGVTATLLACRVRLGASSMPRTPQTHLALSVALPSGPMLVDPGFGGPGPRVPVPLSLGAIVRDGDRVFRIAEGPDDHWALQAHMDGAFTDLYHVTREPRYAVDFVVANHFTATFPHSLFVNQLLLQRATEDGSVSVRNRTLTLRDGLGVTRREIADRAELRAVLSDHFGIELPEAERLVVPAVPAWSTPKG